MAKTNPIGVRFDQALLNVFKEDNIADSPQKALNYLTEFYRNNRQKIDLTPLFEKSKLFEKEPVKIIEKTFQQHMNELPNLDTEYDYRNKATEIESALNLTRKQKDLLILNMRQSKL